VNNTESTKKILSIFRLSDKLDDNSALIAHPLVSAELTLNGEILDVKKMKRAEFAPQLLITSKSVWTKNLAVIAEIKLDNNIARILIINDKIIGAQLGNILGNKALETLSSLKTETIDVSIMTIDINKVPSISSIIAEELKSKSTEIETVTTKEIIKTGTLTEISKEAETQLQIAQQPTTQPQITRPVTVDVTEVLRPIYDDIYLLVRKYGLNLISAPEVKLENNEIYIQIRISPISGLLAARTKKKFINELRELVQSKKGLLARISLEEVIETS